MTAQKGLFSASRLLFYALSLGIIFFVFFHFAEIKKVQMTFKTVDSWWIVIAVIAQALTYLSLSLIHKTLLHSLKENPPSLWTLYKASIVVLFINQAIPTGGVSGNGFLFDFFNKKGVTPSKSFLTIVCEILSFYVGTISAIFISLVIYITTYKTISGVVFITALGGTIFFLALAVVVTIVSQKQTLAFITNKLSRFKLVSRYLKNMRFAPVDIQDEHFNTAPWKFYLSNPRQLFLSSVFQFLIIILDAFTVYALLQGLHIPLPFLLAFFCFVFTSIIAALPISPGSLLIYEGAMTYFYTMVGVPFYAALSITILYRALSFWLPIPIGLILYRHMTK